MVRSWIYSCFSYLASSGSSHIGGAADQAPTQTLQSPADVAPVDLPDLGVEDVLEMQLRQLTVAQFTVATMEHAIPLLKTGRSQSVFLNTKSVVSVCFYSFFSFVKGYCKCLLTCFFLFTRICQLLDFFFDLVKKSLPLLFCFSLSFPFLRRSACVPSCSGAAERRRPPAWGQRLWAGLGRAQPGGDGAGKSTQLMTASYVDEWIHFTEKGNWVGHKTICHKYAGMRLLTCQGELRACDWVKWII